MGQPIEKTSAATNGTNSPSSTPVAERAARLKWSASSLEISRLDPAYGPPYFSSIRIRGGAASRVIGRLPGGRLRRVSTVDAARGDWRRLSVTCRQCQPNSPHCWTSPGDRIVADPLEPATVTTAFSTTADAIRGDAICNVQELSKQFVQRGRPVLALDSIDVSIEPGEFVAIVGASGCGKTTLLNIMAGLIEPSGGKLERAPHVERKGGIGMVFQSPVLLPWRTVVDNVIAPAEILGLPMSSARQRAGELLQKVGLTGFETALPYQLSGGMQQRVSICRALLSDPPLLLMDEPFGALDSLTRERMNLELQRIWTDGSKTVVLVTHSIEEAVFLSDRIIVMTPRPGRIAEILVNELPRPRTVATYEEQLFAEYCGTIRRIILEADSRVS